MNLLSLLVNIARVHVDIVAAKLAAKIEPRLVAELERARKRRALHRWPSAMRRFDHEAAN